MSSQLINNFLFGGIVCFLFGACGGSSQQKKNTAVLTDSTAQVQQGLQTQFPFPEIPTMLTQPESGRRISWRTTGITLTLRIRHW